MYHEDDTLITIEDDDDFELCLQKTVLKDVKEVTFIIQFEQANDQDQAELVPLSKPVTKKDNKNKKEMQSDIPLKALQNLISKELKGQLADIFTELIQSKYTSKVDQMQPQFECNNCGVKPIEGVRYACNECKNFNFCATCEDKVKHEHYFLKIRPVTDSLAESKMDQSDEVPKTDGNQQQFNQLVNSYMEKCCNQPEKEKNTGLIFNQNSVPFKPTAFQTQANDLGNAELYKIAIKLTEANYGSFDECFKAVKETNCDEEASIKVLQRT